MSQQSMLGKAAPTLRPARRKRTALQSRQARLAWMMLFPTLLVVGIVAAYPFARTIYDSLTDAQFAPGPTHFVGLKNYADLISDVFFRNAVVETVKFTVISVSFEFVLGIIIALVVNSSFAGRGLTRAAMLVPWAIVTVISASMWKLMYNDVYGVINDMLERAGLLNHAIAFTSLPGTALPAVAAVDIWKTTPFVALLLLAGLQVIPTDVYEASRVDGANPFQQFWRITLPLLRPAILVALIFRTLDALRVFDVFFVFFGGRLDTMTMAVYDQQNIVNFGLVGYGAAISVAIFVIIGIFVVIYVTALRVERT